jgi:hypothetical protein
MKIKPTLMMGFSFNGIYQESKFISAEAQTICYNQTEEEEIKYRIRDQKMSSYSCKYVDLFCLPRQKSILDHL